MRAVTAFVAGLLAVIGAGVALVATALPPLNTGTVSGRVVFHPGERTQATVYVFSEPVPSTGLVRVYVCPQSCLTLPPLQRSKLRRSIEVRPDGTFAGSLPVGSYLLGAKGQFGRNGSYLCGGGIVNVEPGINTRIIVSCVLMRVLEPTRVIG